MTSQVVSPTLPKTSAGFPQPYGASIRDGGINFAIFSSHATELSICLFKQGESDILWEIPLDPLVNKTGDIWHIFIESQLTQLSYGFRVNGPHDFEKGHLFDNTFILLDPYAKAVESSSVWNEGKTVLSHRGVVIGNDTFDWEDDRHLSIPLNEMIIYEMHVRGFTQDPSSQVKQRGTFSGIIEKIPYLKELGVTTVELLPIHEFNENEFPRQNPLTGELLVNYWGYSTLNFFSPMNRFSAGPTPLDTLHEFKALVKALHSAGIEVILDVVFNHTSEGNEKGPTQSFRGLENNIYYMLTPDGHYYNFSGCGNTLNCNHPVVRELIHDCLRYWVTEMHIDGFRFDLASILGRAADGSPLPNPPLLERIALDPLFSKTKLIAEAWDAAGLYQVGSFPSWDVWAEWNGQYRDVVRRFIKGERGTAADFATRLCGSEDLYGDGRSPGHSVNFITCHDGFTLNDLVSYNQKHNDENGESNRDGCNDNASWNCGAEGETQDEQVLALRQRQMRNFHLALMLSQGVPMLHMGDEYQHSKRGNNNTWCQDNALSWFSWEKLEEKKDFFRFYKLMIHFRKKHPILYRSYFLSDREIEWHGQRPLNPDWESEKPFVAFTLKCDRGEGDLYIAFNAHASATLLTLPSPRQGQTWCRVVDTSLRPPYDIQPEGGSVPFKGKKYLLKPYTSIILKSKF
jgi:isoamylase/glycogen operon protein